MAEPLAASRLVSGTNSATGASTTSQTPVHAGIFSRIYAYIVDSVVLVAFGMVFVAIAMVNVLMNTDGGQIDSNEAISDSVVVALLAIPAWLLLGVFFDYKRGQSLGKYFVGLRVVREDGRSATFSRHLLHWLAFHPLLFNPILALFWLLFTLASVSFSGSDLLYFAGGAATIACLLVPLVNLLFALGDPQRRGVHDLIAGMKVVRIE